jgi:hypothetical protein
VKKRCREEVNPIPSIYDEEIGSLRNRDFDDDVEDMIRCIPLFESCKVSLHRSRAKETFPVTPVVTTSSY